MRFFFVPSFSALQVLFVDVSGPFLFEKMAPRRGHTLFLGSRSLSFYIGIERHSCRKKIGKYAHGFFTPVHVFLNMFRKTSHVPGNFLSTCNRFCATSTRNRHFHLPWASRCLTRYFTSRLLSKHFSCDVNEDSAPTGWFRGCMWATRWAACELQSGLRWPLKGIAMGSRWLQEPPRGMLSSSSSRIRSTSSSSR